MICCTLAVIVDLAIQNKTQQRNGRNNTFSVQGVFITEGRRAVCTCGASNMIAGVDELCHMW